MPQPSQRCGTPDFRALTVRFATSHGDVLDGAIVGSGPVGVVLLHEYPGPMCGWWPYAVYLAQHGAHALLFDFSCLGLSGCPPTGRSDPIADTAAAIRELREHGARSVALVGASFGGVVAVLAGARLHPAAVVDLSGERDLTGLLPGVRLNSYAVASGLRAPALFVVAKDDRDVSVADMRAVEARAASPIKRLIVLSASAGHGWDMLTGQGLAWAPLAREVLAFSLNHRDK